MKIKNVYLYLSLVAIHVFLVFIAFPAFFSHRGDIMFCNWGDGVKNYFTLNSYVKSPIGTDGLFKYSSFSYPFGDYVYYTDNTPLFSIPFKWYCGHISDLSRYTTPAFNLFILGNIIASALLVFYIFKRFLGKNVFSYGLAIILPWINMQMPRIWEGDFNLSCSTPVLAAICLFIAWYNNNGNIRRQVVVAAAMMAMLFLSFLMHGYYIAIVSIFVGAMLFFCGLILFRQRSGKLSVAMSIIVPVSALAAVLALLHYTDKYLDLRPKNAMLYDWSTLKTNFILLFTHYDFHSLAFPVASTKPMDMEIMVYLGNIGLFAFGAIWTGAVFSTSFRKRVFSIQKLFFADPLKKAVFWGGFLMLMISFGEYYTSNRDELVIYTPVHWLNSLNTFLLLAIIVAIALVTYGIVLLVNPQARDTLKKIGQDYKQRPYKKAGLLFCIALMIYLFVAHYSVTAINPFNPLLYMHFFTKEVEQFRSLSRFSWPFFWTFYLWIMFTVIQLYYSSGRRARVIIVLSFVVVGAIELTDYIVKIRKDANNSDLFADTKLNEFSKLKIDATQYQAILPIPYYMVGSEDYPHTIDDNLQWSIFTMQLSLYSHLPLMSCKMSRTPPSFALALLNLISNDSVGPDLEGLFNDKPILVSMDRSLVDDPSQAKGCTSGRPLTMEYYTKANAFVNRHHLSPVDSMGNVLFYSWNPK